MGLHALAELAAKKNKSIKVVIMSSVKKFMTEWFKLKGAAGTVHARRQPENG